MKTPVRFISAFILLLVGLLSHSAFAVPIEITTAMQWRDFRGANSVGWVTDDQHVIMALVKDLAGNPAPNDTLVGSIIPQGINPPLVVQPLFRTPDILEEFVSVTPYGTHFTTAHLIGAQSGSDTDFRQTNDISGITNPPTFWNVNS